MSWGVGPSSRVRKSFRGGALSLEQRIGLRPVPGGRGHVIFGSDDLSPERFNTRFKLMVRHGVEILFRQERQGIVGFGWGEVVIHAQQR